MIRTEDDVRAALHALAADAPDAAAVRSAVALAPKPGRPHRAGRRAVPLAAAASVLLVVIATVAVSRNVGPGTPPRHRPAPAPGQPRYLVNYPARGVGLLDVRNAVTGALAATVRTHDYLGGGYWYALAAQGPRTFIASEDETLGLPPAARSVSRFYRFVLGRNGTVTSIRRVGHVVHGAVAGASVTPDGKRIAYLVMTDSGKHNGQPEVRIVIASLVTGRVIASWPVPWADSIVSLSLDSAGDTLAISAYTYNPPSVYRDVLAHADLVQWTSVLRPATAGTPVDKLPRLVAQASTLALSPDGRTVYEFLQAGGVTGRSWRDRDPVTFNLAAVSVRTGAVESVLHTWRAAWAHFMPVLALGPDGRYLLIAEGTSLARVSTTSGRYTATGGFPPLEVNGKFPSATQGGALDPLAW